MTELAVAGTESAGAPAQRTVSVSADAGRGALRVALAQLDTVVGDLAGNVARLREAAAAAHASGADLVIFPELALTGYPPEDLLLRPHFLRDTEAALDEFVRSLPDGLVALVGVPTFADDVYNSAVVATRGRVHARHHKVHLPNYGVFDERRYFRPGNGALLVELGEASVGVTVCEDIWVADGPHVEQAAAGADVIVNLSASPYHRGKGRDRERMLRQRAADLVAFVVFCNLVGGQDELVFDGHSLVCGPRGELLARAAQFEETVLVCDLDIAAARAQRLHDPRHRSLFPASAGAVRRVGLEHIERASRATLADDARGSRSDPYAGGPAVPIVSLLDESEEVYRALVVGLRDYVEKNRFERVVVGLSGGIDSALTAVVAVDALGSERVELVTMPSPYSSSGTRADARAIAERLGVELRTLAIEPAMQAFSAILREQFAGRPPDVTEENIQARIRGTLLMALSNKFGWLVLTTGNKSELSVGYATLYGDMAGGFAVLKDLFKTHVYQLARWRNEQAQRLGEVPPIPQSVIDRPPSAELRPGQRDDETLPPYELLDAILESYVERDLDAAALVRRGYPADIVERVLAMVDAAEYKRRQAPPGVRVSVRAFGRDRRVPITNRYRSGADRR